MEGTEKAWRVGPLGRVAAVLVAAVAIVSGCGARNASSSAQLGPCLPGQTAGCSAPDLEVVYPSSVADSQLSQYLDTLFKNKAELAQFSDAPFVADFPRHRLLISWPKGWPLSRQQALISFLRSQPQVISVSRV